MGEYSEYEVLWIVLEPVDDICHWYGVYDSQGKAEEARDYYELSDDEIEYLFVVPVQFNRVEYKRIAIDTERGRL